KMYVTSRALHFRNSHRDLFAKGSYLPLAAAGSRANHAVAFARNFSGTTAIVLAGRYFMKLCNSHRSPLGEASGNTAVTLPAKIRHRCFQDVFTGQIVAAAPRDGEAAISLAKAFSHCPVALLSGIDQVPCEN